MRNFRYFVFFLASATASAAQGQESVKLTDVIKSNGSGHIDLFKDVTAIQLEQFRIEHDGSIVLAVDVNEDARGTEKASSQAVTLKSLTLTITYNDDVQAAYDSNEDCCFTETKALLAEAPGTERQLHYTMLGDTGSNRITSSNTIQDEFDSTLKIAVPDSIYDASLGIEAISAVIDITLLDTNTSLGDPEAFYDYSNGFEDLALVNAADAAFLDDFGAGRDEAPTVILTNPPAVVDPLAITNWNYFPSANSFYLVGYEDLYPGIGDYDFNDLTVAYQVKHGLNSDNQVVSIQGTAYLLTRGAGYSHDWRLNIALASEASGTLNCTTSLDPMDPAIVQPCDAENPTTFSGSADILVFSDTSEIFRDPLGSIFANTLPDRPFTNGPKSTFRMDFDAPLVTGAVGSAPFDPYLHVINTGKDIQLLQVNPEFTDANGYPFGMLMPIDWLPPIEFTDIGYTYPSFVEFVESKGTLSVDWYNTFLSQYIVGIPSMTEWAW